jgi:hypothetical protein
MNHYVINHGDVMDEAVITFLNRMTAQAIHGQTVCHSTHLLFGLSNPPFMG